MKQFNVGDRVRRLSNFNEFMREGPVYTVSAIGPEFIGILEYIDGPLDCGWDPDCFELVEPVNLENE